MASSCSSSTSARSVDEQATAATRLWGDRGRAVSTPDPAALAATESGVALTMDRASYVTYLPGVHLSVLEPRTSAVPHVVARTHDSFVATVSAWWTVDHREQLIWTLFRADKTGGRYRISVVFDRPDGPFPASSDVVHLGRLSSAGRTLVADVGAFRQYTRAHGTLPPWLAFVDNRLTTGYVDAVKTHKTPESWEVSTESTKIAASTNTSGFSIPLDGGVLSCGVLETTGTIRHRAGEPIRPEPVLGDEGFRVADGLYDSFTEIDEESVCVRHGGTGRPEVVSVISIPTVVTGTPAR